MNQLGKRCSTGACPPKSRRLGRRRGFTLIELLVSATIIVLMLMIVGTILSAAQKTVSATEAFIRANAKVAAMRTVVREDLRRATKMGFICLAQAPDGSPRLIFTTAGYANSATGATSSNGTLEIIGTVNDTASPPVGIVYRQAMMLNYVCDDPSWTWYRANPEQGIEDYGSLQTRRRDPSTPIEPRYHPNPINEFIDYIIPGAPGAAIPVAPLNIDRAGVSLLDIQEYFWKVLCTKAYNLSIMWTDGSVDNSNPAKPLKWYGVSWNRTLNSGAGGYEVIAFDPAYATAGRTANSSVIDAAGDNCFLLEFPDNGYRAIWSKEYPNAVFDPGGNKIRPGWPVAIKLRFTMRDEYVPKDFNDAEYEIVCPVAQ